MTQFVVRIAPSPTGKAHLGVIRTALFNYLFSIKTGALYIHRNENTDIERCKEEYLENIIDSMKWLKLPTRGDNIPFINQLDCTDTHNEYLQLLFENGLIFPCYVTEEELEAMRNTAAEQHINFVYWSPYRDMTIAEHKEKMAHTPFVYRMKTPKNEIIEYTDMVYGPIKVNSNTLGDFAVARSDGSVLYHFANIIDDIEQHITHVIRGEDHVPNTPKHIIIYKAIQQVKDITIPHIAHIPLVVDSDRKKLSKRRVKPGVAVLIDDFRTLGFIPEAVSNGIAMLGFTPKSDTEVLTVQELGDLFELTKVSPAPSQYDFQKMLWFSHEWMKRLTDEQLLSYYRDYRHFLHMHNDVKESYLDSTDDTLLLSSLKLCSSKTGIFSAMEYDLEYLLQRPHTILIEDKQAIIDDIHKLFKSFTDDTSWNYDILKSRTIEHIKAIGSTNSEYLTVFRTMLSSKTPSIGPFEIAMCIGKKECLERVEQYV